MRRRLARLALPLPLAAFLAGCAPALREPPPLPEIGSPRDPAVRTDPPEGVDGFLAQAASAFAERDTASVRRASDLWLRAAAADPARTEGLLGAAQANVWLSDHEPAPAARREAAERAVYAAQWCGRIAPADPACAYWLGAGLGVAARERPSTGLSALPKIEESFLRASREAPDLDDAGPFRALALLYLRAPGWPTGPGDPDRGLEMARQAVSRRPDYPPNQLALAEALAKTDAPSEAIEACRRAAALLASPPEGSAAPPPAETTEWRRESEACLARLAGRS
jgi:hypothetical protein